MARIENILLKVSETIADPEFLRYSKPTVLRTINEAINNFSMLTKVIRRRYFVGIEKGMAEYKLRNYLHNIDRVQFMYQVLEVKTEEEMDEINLKWQEEVGEVPKYVIFDNLNQCNFRIYPKLVANTIDIVDYNSIYGCISDIELTDDTIFIPHKGCGNFNKAFLIVYGAGVHKTVYETTEDDDLEWGSIYDDAIIAYTAGQLYRMNADSLNRQLGAEQLQIYSGIVGETMKKEAKANNTTLRELNYIGFPK